ncbi:bifunctional enoyl-CoA hydratase/phosphate acetyltransferase [Abyssisolibacter fermentans]|uniref:bifunctional enoyl-CoA hydratase/phosphate acetyltransferase n=1 Tax=Abyssisolibacter fermentans TaxID=1766203 RepID=UPI000A9A334B
MNSLNELITKAQDQPTKTLAVAAPQDKEVLQAVVEAANMGIVRPILIGDIEETKRIANELNINIDDYETVQTKDLKESAEVAVKYVSSNKADFVMKGLIDTSILLKEVLNKEYGLRTDSLLSHVMVYEVPNYHKLLFLTDGGMNISPNEEQKIKIIKNAVKASRILEKDEIKVAILAAKEKVNEKMQATVDAGNIKQKYLEGYFEKGVIVEGPMALDLAISKDAAKIKNYKSPVAGDADILVVPNIEMGNGIGKTLTYFAGSLSAGIIMGAKAPVVLVSRADSHQAKLNSIALGSLISAV